MFGVPPNCAALFYCPEIIYEVNAIGVNNKKFLENVQMGKKDELLYELESELFFSGNPNMNKVLSLCNKGIELGLTEAKLILGKLYMWGKVESKPNYDKAYNLFWEAANEKSAEACLFVGSFNYDGVAVEKNYELTVHYFSKSIEYYKKIIGTDDESVLDIENYGQALGMLALCLFDGKGTAINYNDAFKYAYEGATYCKNSMSMAILGYCYYYGYGTNESEEEAQRWWQMGIKIDNNKFCKIAYDNFFNNNEEYDEQE